MLNIVSGTGGVGRRRRGAELMELYSSVCICWGREGRTSVRNQIILSNGKFYKENKTQSCDGVPGEGVVRVLILGVGEGPSVTGNK